MFLDEKLTKQNAKSSKKVKTAKKNFNRLLGGAAPEMKVGQNTQQKMLLFSAVCFQLIVHKQTIILHKSNEKGR